MSYDKIPAAATLKPTKFEANVPEDKLAEFKQLLKLSRVGKQTYENQQADERYGITHKWLSDAKDHWLNSFDWRAHEKKINSFPNFTASIKDDDGQDYTVHFVGLFSEKKDAIPIILVHGWPGSFLEFLDILALFKKQYSASDLPYHLIVPSICGYAWSSDPPTNKNWECEDDARILHKLMVGLGFGSGYAAQGGDLGAFITRIMGAHYDECKTHHTNFGIMAAPENMAELKITEAEGAGLQRTGAFTTTGNAYAIEHGTRPATIGHVLNANPISLLAWIGEKFLHWVDDPLPLESILESVTLYWFTESYPTSIHPYRQFFYENPAKPNIPNSDPKNYLKRPFGYSYFPKELAPIPESWVATTGDLQFFKAHTKGGHFAAMEQPAALKEDIEGWIAKCYK